MGYPVEHEGARALYFVHVLLTSHQTTHFGVSGRFDEAGSYVMVPELLNLSNLRMNKQNATSEAPLQYMKRKP